MDELAVLLPENSARTTRQAVNGRQNALYDRKYHPIDDYTAPARAAAHRRRLGLPDSKSPPQFTGEEDTASDDFSVADEFSDDGDVTADKRRAKRQAKRVPRKGTRQSQRVSAIAEEVRPLYDETKHPQDAFLPKFPLLEASTKSRKHKTRTNAQNQRKRPKGILHPRVTLVAKPAANVAIPIPDSEEDSNSEDNPSESELEPKPGLKEPEQEPGTEIGRDPSHESETTSTNELNQKPDGEPGKEAEPHASSMKSLVSLASVGIRPQKQPHHPSQLQSGSESGSTREAHRGQRVLNDNELSKPNQSPQINLGPNSGLDSSSFDEFDPDDDSVDGPILDGHDLDRNIGSYSNRNERTAGDDYHSEGEDVEANLLPAGSTQARRAASGIATTYSQLVRFNKFDNSDGDEMELFPLFEPRPALTQTSVQVVIPLYVEKY